MSPLGTDNSGTVTPLSRLGDYAHDAIEKHFKKSVKYKSAVLQDTDPEPLHQMRVGMRRLRTAIQVFEGAVVLPKAAGERQIQQMARVLGRVRDLDVLGDKLTAHYLPHLQGGERQQLETVLQRLEQQRQQRFRKLPKLLKGSRYDNFKQALKTWLDQPVYGAIAPLPITPVLPDLLLPLVSHLLLHPGWLVGTHIGAGKVKILTRLSAEATHDLLVQQGTLLHDLRKVIKAMRYQSEFFVDFYGPAYQQRVEDFQAIQEILGQLQDCAVLAEFMAIHLSPNWPQLLPTLAQRLHQEEFAAWQQWQIQQTQYLDWQFRSDLRHLVMQPLEPKALTQA